MGSFILILQWRIILTQDHSHVSLRNNGLMYSYCWWGTFLTNILQEEDSSQGKKKHSLFHLILTCFFELSHIYLFRYWWKTPNLNENRSTVFFIPIFIHFYLSLFVFIVICFWLLVFIDIFIHLFLFFIYFQVLSPRIMKGMSWKLQI